MKIKTDRQIAWINRLLSGRYKQTTDEVLFEPGKGAYCCLGVSFPAFARRASRNGSINPMCDGDAHMLANDGQDLMGLSDEDQRILIRLNDSGEADFTDIAMVLMLSDASGMPLYKMVPLGSIRKYIDTFESEGVDV